MDVLTSMLAQVQRFHREVTGMPMPDRPVKLEGDGYDSRVRHLEEELDEFSYAKTVEEQADALVDLIYVAMGGLLQMGVAPGPAFDEVHRANMKKKGVGSTDRHAHDASKLSEEDKPRLELYCTVTKEEMDWLLDQREIAASYAPQAVDHEAIERRLNFQPGNSTGPTGERRFSEVSISERLVPRNVPEAFRPERFVGVRPRLPKVLVIGHARHGKDTVSEMLLNDFGFNFTSSSWFCAERVMLPYFQQKVTDWLNFADVNEPCPTVYHSAEECFDDRHNHRKEWYDQISAYCRPDASRLARGIFAENDIYCGLRSSREFHAVKGGGLFDLCVWIDSSGRGIAPEDKESCTIEPWMADVVIDNSGDLLELRLNVHRLMASRFGLSPRA